MTRYVSGSGRCGEECTYLSDGHFSVLVPWPNAVGGPIVIATPDHTTCHYCRQGIALSMVRVLVIRAYRCSPVRVIYPRCGPAQKT